MGRRRGLGSGPKPGSARGYPEPWCFGELNTFSDFLRNDDAVEALCWGYEQFRFAEREGDIRRSPLWQAFWQIKRWSKTGLMWSDLARVDFEGGSFLLAPLREQRIFLSQQRGLALAELQILRPDVCIFLTGPDYDFILEDLFPGLEMSPVDVAPARELATLIHPALPLRSYRTYHPRALRMQKKWDYLSQIERAVLAQE